MALVCLCNGVGDRTIRNAISAGASTVDDIAEACGAGGGCGGCHPTIEELLDEQPVGVVQRLIAS